MWCLISQPNINKNAAMVIEVRLSAKSTGQECLNQVCQKLGIVESDYFGLQFTTARKEEIWLNLRNEIRQEIHGHLFRPASTDGKPAAIHRFRLKAKFWVPPHLILQESTRHQFYLQARVELFEGRFTVVDLLSAVKICALVAQAELGDSTGMSCQLDFYLNNCFSHIVSSLSETPFPTSTFHITKNEWVAQVLKHHQSLKGMSSTLAEYWMLKEVSTLKDYGTEIFKARWIDNGTNCTVAVGPQGVNITSLENAQLLSVPFCAIQAATNHNVRFLLKHRNDLGGIECTALKLDTYQASIALYRSITEKHAFYSCETVRSAVTSQFVRDLKGTIASFFNENTDLGKKYIFDIQRTCREVYDNARRILYQTGDQSSLPVLTLPNLHLDNSESTLCSDSSCKSTKEQLNRLQEALLCRICMDSDISSVFCPCGHAVACSSCALRCTTCPVCRATVTHTQTIFLPLSASSLTTDSSLHAHLAEPIEA